MGSRSYTNFLPWGEEADPEDEDASGYGSEEEDEYEEDQEEADSVIHKCHWTIAPSESCYDDGLLRILTISDKLKIGKCIFGCNLVSIVLLLGFNATLQFMVVERVYQLVDMSRKEKAALVFSPTGNCASNPASLYARVDLTGVVKQPKNWDCGSVFPMALSNTDWLDVNNDGLWSEEDDIAETGKEIMGLYKKTGYLDVAFKHFMKDAKDSKFRFQTSRNLQPAASKTATKDYTAIPMTWMKEEEPVIQLCNNVDPHLCGNLELRGILEKHIPDPAFDADARVDECRSIYDRCLPKFGEIFRSYTKSAEQVCGDISSTWHPSKMVIVNRYSVADKYDPWENKQAIPTVTYESFLLLVLVIWWLIVVGELRAVMSWWAVLLTIPSEDGTVVKNSEEEIEIPSISFCHKIVISLMVLLPRTVIIVCLSFIGTDFLIIADSYSDLILNSVALGFLIEVDEMLFCAVTSKTTKDNIAKMKEIRGSHTCWNCCIIAGTYPTSIPLVIFVVSMSLAQMLKAFEEKNGKIDLSGAFACLCHMEGPGCVAAQILGGLARVP